MYIYIRIVHSNILCIYMYIYNMCDEKNVCILHRCSKAIVNIYIYIYTKKIFCVYIYIYCKHIHLTLVGMYTTYTHCISNVDQKIILKKKLYIASRCV